MKLLFLLFAALAAPSLACAWLAPDVEALARAAGNLEEFRSGGSFGCLYAAEGGGNVAVGVGVAPLGNDFERGRRLALADATARVTEALNGSAVATRTDAERAAGTETLRTLTEKSVSGKAGGIRVRGYWVQDGTFVVVACRYVGAKPCATRDDFSEAAEDVKLSATWTEALSRCREIWLGGVCPLYDARDGKLYLGAVVSVKREASPVAAESLWRNAATRDLGKYASGADFEEELRLAEESVVRAGADGEETEESESSLRVRTRERTKAVVGPMKKAGTFTHKISGRRCALFVAEIEKR